MVRQNPQSGWHPMQRFPTLPLIRACLGLALLPAFAPAARSQAFLGLAGGFNASAGPSAFGQSYSQGFTGQGFVGHRFAAHFGARLETLVSHFTSASSLLYAYANEPPCPWSSCSLQPAPPFPVGTVGVAELGASGLVDVIPAPPGSAGIYVIPGGGASYLYHHPTPPGAGGFRLPGGAAGRTPRSPAPPHLLGS